MKLFVFFPIIFILPYTALANTNNNENVKQETINDCQYIAGFFNYVNNNCCNIYGITCDENGRITYM